MATARIILPGSRRGVLRDAVTLGDADPSALAKVTVVVRRNEEPLPITPFGVITNREHYFGKHGASAKDLSAVRKFAAGSGLQSTNMSAATRTIELSGTVASLCNAFHVKLRRVLCHGQVYRVREGEISIPTALGGAVQAVLGLDDRRVASSMFYNSEFAQHGALSPDDISRVYELPEKLLGAGQTIAIIELDGGFLGADLVGYFGRIERPVPSTRTVLIDGQTNTIAKYLPSQPELNADAGVALDMQLIGTIAPQAKQVIYFAQNTDQSFLKAVNMALQARTLPTVICISWGAAEADHTDQFKISFEQALQDAANLGVTVCVASGDTARLGKDAASAVSFPASAPHALACGGSSLRKDAKGLAIESRWKSTVQAAGDRFVATSSAGGASSFFNRPIYQQALQVSSTGDSPAGGRSVPDVCANSDPATGYRIRLNGQEVIVGGTAAAAALWSGLIARIAQGVKQPVGYLHPKLYKSSVFQRALQPTGNATRTVSGNAGFATVWCPYTGLGSPRGKELLKVLNDSLPRIPGKPKVVDHKLKPQLAAKSALKVASPARPKASPEAAKSKPGTAIPPRLSTRSIERPRTLENARAVTRRSAVPLTPERPVPSLTVSARVNLSPQPIPALLRSPSPPALRTEVRGPDSSPQRPRSQEDSVTAASSMMGLVMLMGCVASAGLAATLAISEESK